MRKETLVYKAVPGCEIRADVYRPDERSVLPAIIWIHGGALITGSRSGISPSERDRYLDAGFAVICIDYRLAPETHLASIVEDVRDALAWVQAEGPSLFQIDPSRIAAVGHSAGGYLALLSGCWVAPRLRAIVAYYGYGDIVGDWYSRPDPFYRRQPIVTEEAARASIGNCPLSAASGPDAQRRSSFYLYCRQQGRWPREVAGSDPDTEPEVFDRFCPVRQVTAAYPATLLLHGDRDTDVPYEQSTRMAAALARAGVEHELITIAGGGHGFDRDLDQTEVAAALERADGFLRRHLTDKQET